MPVSFINTIRFADIWGTKHPSGGPTSADDRDDNPTKTCCVLHLIGRSWSSFNGNRHVATGSQNNPSFQTVFTCRHNSSRCETHNDSWPFEHKRNIFLGPPVDSNAELITSCTIAFPPVKSVIGGTISMFAVENLWKTNVKEMKEMQEIKEMKAVTVERVDRRGERGERY